MPLLPFLGSGRSRLQTLLAACTETEMLPPIMQKRHTLPPEVNGAERTTAEAKAVILHLKTGRRPLFLPSDLGRTRVERGRDRPY